MRTPTLDRFWGNVQKSEGCWNWTGFRRTKKDAYGGFKYEGKHWLSHRLAYHLLVGPIPEGMHLLHRCDNQSCCNPEHLFIGTNQDNVDDKMQKRRHFMSNRDHCKNGHQFDGVVFRPDGKNRRTCKKCRLVVSARYRERNPGKSAAAMASWESRNKERRNEYKRQRRLQKKAQNERVAKDCIDRVLSEAVAGPTAPGA